MDINWYPGHMTKTKRKIQQSLKLIDLVVEILDSRIPISSSNPDLKNIIQNKPKIVLLNKCDKANKQATQKWIGYYAKNNTVALAVDCRSGKGINQFAPAVRKVLKDKYKSLENKGIKNPVLRVMIVGIPNVGKSSFINRIAKHSSAKVEDRPGVTRGNQWYTIAKDLEMLDTPGILWPKFDDETVGEHLAFTGAIKDTILDCELLATKLIDILKRDGSSQFKARFKLENEDISDKGGYDLLGIIGKKRGILISGGEIDTERTANMILDEFRDGKFGNITLEYPEDL